MPMFWDSTLPEDLYAQAKIARLERELADEKLAYRSAADAAKELLRENSTIEAQAAAMREALELAIGAIEDVSKNTNYSFDPTFEEGNFVKRLKAALTPDAGRKVLAVAEAAKEFLTSAKHEADVVNRGISGHHAARMSDLRQALAALEEK